MTTTTISTFQAVKKPIFFPRFNSVLPDDAVKLAYAAAESLDADQNITLIDRSKSMPENSVTFLPDDETLIGDGFTSVYSDILITDVFTDAIPSQPVIPLFSIHELPSDVVVDSITVYDKNFKAISSSQYVVDVVYVRDGSGTETSVVDYVALYNNFVNSFDEDTGELIVYYVQYTDSSNVTLTVMINNSPIFHEASFEDIDWSTMKLKEWAKAYTSRERSLYYEYTLPQSTTYGIRYLETPTIELIKPVVDNNTVPWFVRVRNNSFAITYNDVRYTYRIPEFNTQAFNPTAPWKLVAEELCPVVGDNLIKVLHTPTAIDTWPLDVVIKDKNGSPLYAFTTNSGKDGTDYYEGTTDSGINWDANKILSYDAASGLVQLHVVLKDYYQVYATYYYEEEYYEYSLINLNPLTNQDVLEHFYVVYLVPESSTNGNLGVQNVSIHYLKVGRDGLIKDTSQDGTNGEPDLKTLIESPNSMYYGRPDFSAGSFLNDYSLECAIGQDGEDRRYLILGEVAVVQQTSIEDLTILDDRQRGGGLQEDQVIAAKTINPEVLWYTDIGMGGGLPYPGLATVIVKLPHCLLDTYGGPFSETAITEIVKRHLSFGTYPLIRYYGIIPELTIEDNTVSGEITISWNSVDNLTTYNVFYTTSGDFAQHNVSPIADNPAGNSYTLDGLTDGNVYRIYIQAVRDNPCALPKEINMPGTLFYIGGDNGSSWDSHAGPKSKTITVALGSI